jgi:CHAT domain-containing protein
LGGGDGEDGLLSVLDLADLRVAADLVVLSACETARGRVLGTEGVIGLPRALFLAGCPRVLASLWKVDDEATKALMVKFYELWNPRDGSAGLGPAAALEAAQEAMRADPSGATRSTGLRGSSGVFPTEEVAPHATRRPRSG